MVARAGMVSGTGQDPALGRYVAIKGGGYETRYGHLSAVLVLEGQKVEAGQVIGRVGNTGISTGPHLDFRVRFAGQYQNPLQYF
ncbi:MAG: M23 family metallopeptidase [Bacillota bacterium]